MEGKLALLYLIFMLIVTIAYVEVSPIKHAKPSPIVPRIRLHPSKSWASRGAAQKEKKKWLLYCTTCGAAIADSIGRCAASEIATLSALAKQP